MRSNLIAGLDIGTTKTSVLIAEVLGEGQRRPELRVLGVGQARTGGVRRDVVTHIEETTESVRTAVQEAELMAGVTVDRVWTAIGGDHVRTLSSMGVVAVGGEEISRGDLDRVHEVARAVALPPDREFLHAIPQEYKVDHQAGIKDPLGMSGTRLEADVYLVTGAAQAAGNLRKAVQRAGYRVQALVLSPLATAHAVLTEDEKEVGVALMGIGASTTEVCAFHEGKIRHIAVLPLGGDTITNDLVRGLSIPFAEAQRAKERHGVAFAQLVDPQETVELPGPGPGQTRQVARELIAHIVEQRLDEIYGLVHRELEDAGCMETLGAGLVLTGGGAALQGSLEMAQQCMGMPARIGVPGEGLSGLADSVARPRFSTVTGLCLYGADRFHETGQGVSTLSSGLMTRIGAWVREFF
ncbi:MAG: cell division protein FtsA [Gemmatimonadales bacterium]|nr:MAG: cell division protein FtsA [Gemmatimonadales bacterium]